MGPCRVLRVWSPTTSGQARGAGQVFRGAGQVFRGAGQLFRRAEQLFRRAEQLYMRAEQLFRRAAFWGEYRRLFLGHRSIDPHY